MPSTVPVNSLHRVCVQTIHPLSTQQEPDFHFSDASDTTTLVDDTSASTPCHPQNQAQPYDSTQSFSISNSQGEPAPRHARHVSSLADSSLPPDSTAPTPDGIPTQPEGMPPSEDPSLAPGPSEPIPDEELYGPGMAIVRSAGELQTAVRTNTDTVSWDAMHLS